MARNFLYSPLYLRKRYDKGGGLEGSGECLRMTWAHGGEEWLSRRIYSHFGG